MHLINIWSFNHIVCFWITSYVSWVFIMWTLDSIAVSQFVRVSIGQQWTTLPICFGSWSKDKLRQQFYVDPESIVQRSEPASPGSAQVAPPVEQPDQKQEGKMIKHGNDNFSVTSNEEGHTKTENCPSGKISESESFPTDHTAPNPNKEELNHCPMPMRQDFFEINPGNPIGNRIKQISLHFVDSVTFLLFLWVLWVEHLLEQSVSRY